MPHKSCIDFNQADCGQLETSDCFTLTRCFGANQNSNVILVVVNVPHEHENQGQHHLHGYLVGRGWGECDTQWVNFVLPRDLCEISGMYGLAAYTWHFPYCAVVWQTQTLDLLPPQPLLFHALTHYWRCSEKDSGVCALLGPSVWRYHLSIFQAFHKIRSET